MYAISAEIVSSDGEKSYNLNNLPCEITPIWVEHFGWKKKYLDSLDSFYREVKEVTNNTMETVLLCNIAATSASITADQVKKLLIFAVNAKENIADYSR